MMKRKEKVNWTFMKIVLLVGLIVYAICLFGPVIWGVITSFKGQADFRINVIGLPKEWVWNYSQILEKFVVQIFTDVGTVEVGMGEMLMNSVLYAVGCAFFSALIPCITSYLCARYDYFLSRVIYTIVIVAMILPIVGSLPSEIRVARAIGSYDHIWGMWLFKANFLGLYFIVFYNHFKSIPQTYAEAAKIDGAGNWDILLKIMLPLARNTFFTVMLIRFIEFWNDYQTPLVYLPTKPTISLGVYHMAYTTINELSTVPMRMSAAVIAITPILILFLSFHKRLLGNLTVGGIKG
ncbi:MAG: carbohydrate ABC transporter permease [Tyzzerella sp.]|nr:carbohydrate ABC transporter permease [Tyzzerella sp.]